MSRYIDEHRGRFGVEAICRTLDASASAYHQRATGERSERQVADEQLLAQIKATHEANYCAYGYRKMWLALKRGGHDVGRDQHQAADAPARDPGRQAARPAVAHHDRGRVRCASA